MPGVNHTITGEQTPAGGFVLGGFTVLPESGMRSALLVKTDGESFGYTVRATADGGAILTGHTTEGRNGATGGRGPRPGWAL